VGGEGWRVGASIYSAGLALARWPRLLGDM